MRISSFVAVLVLLGFIIGCNAENREDVTEWYNYGDTITKTEIMTVSQAVERLDELTGQPVFVEGVITQVCQTRGCWMVVEEGGQSIRVRFADYGFFVPWESAGKPVRIQGTMKKETVSEDVARHWAEEADDPAVEPEDIHGDQEVIMFMATAASIKGGTPLSDEQKLVIEGNDEHDHTH